MTHRLNEREFDAYVARHAKWNLAVNVLDLTFYHFANSFIFGATVLTLYASYLTSSSILIGIIPAIQSVGYFLPQLLMARQAEMASSKKPIVQRISVTERAPYLVIALGILLWPDAPAWAAYTMLAVSLAVATGSGGLAGPAWKAMLGKVVPVERRGVLFGLSNALGGLLGVVGTMVSRRVLAEFTYPTSFGICFLLAFAFQVVSWIFLSLNREPAKEPAREVTTARAYWRKLPGVLRDHPNFARYLIGRSLITLGAMGTAFYVVYARHTFQVGDEFAANLTMAALISQTAATPLFGWLADKRGHKWLTELCTVIGAGGVLMVLLAPDAGWLYAVYALTNAATAGMYVAGMGITMEFCPPENLPTFTALASTILAAPILLAPVVGGGLVDLMGYPALFAVALACASLGWTVMHWAVVEPRHVSSEPGPIRVEAQSAPVTKGT